MAWWPAVTFWRKRPVELTTDAHARWLRAGRPPYEPFLRLSQIEQEALAAIGDEFDTDRAIALAYAIADPETADAGVDAVESPAAEETLVRRLAAGFIDRIQKGRETEPEPAQEPSGPPRESLAGFGDRRTETHTDKRRTPSLFGAEPTTRRAP